MIVDHLSPLVLKRKFKNVNFALNDLIPNIMKQQNFKDGSIFMTEAISLLNDVILPLDASEVSNTFDKNNELVRYPGHHRRMLKATTTGGYVADFESIRLICCTQFVRFLNMVYAGCPIRDYMLTSHVVLSTKNKKGTFVGPLTCFGETLNTNQFRSLVELASVFEREISNPYNVLDFTNKGIIYRLSDSLFNLAKAISNKAKPDNVVAYTLTLLLSIFMKLFELFSADATSLVTHVNNCDNTVLKDFLTAENFKLETESLVKKEILQKVTAALSSTSVQKKYFFNEILKFDTTFGGLVFKEDLPVEMKNIVVSEVERALMDGFVQWVKFSENLNQMKGFIEHSLYKAYVEHTSVPTLIKKYASWFLNPTEPVTLEYRTHESIDVQKAEYEKRDMLSTLTVMDTILSHWYDTCSISDFLDVSLYSGFFDGNELIFHVNFNEERPTGISALSAAIAAGNLLDHARDALVTVHHKYTRYLGFGATKVPLEAFKQNVRPQKANLSANGVIITGDSSRLYEYMRHAACTIDVEELGLGEKTFVISASYGVYSIFPNQEGERGVSFGGSVSTRRQDVGNYFSVKYFPFVPSDTLDIKKIDVIDILMSFPQRELFSANSPLLGVDVKARSDFLKTKYENRLSQLTTLDNDLPEIKFSPLIAVKQDIKPFLGLAYLFKGDDVYESIVRRLVRTYLPHGITKKQFEKNSLPKSVSLPGQYTAHFTIPGAAFGAHILTSVIGSAGEFKGPINEYGIPCVVFKAMRDQEKEGCYEVELNFITSRDFKFAGGVESLHYEDDGFKVNEVIVNINYGVPFIDDSLKRTRNVLLTRDGVCEDNRSLFRPTPINPASESLLEHALDYMQFLIISAYKAFLKPSDICEDCDLAIVKSELSATINDMIDNIIGDVTGVSIGLTTTKRLSEFLTEVLQVLETPTQVGWESVINQLNSSVAHEKFSQFGLVSTIPVDRSFSRYYEEILKKRKDYLPMPVIVSDVDVAGLKDYFSDPVVLRVVKSTIVNNINKQVNMVFQSLNDGGSV